jgi:hypothetical protein
MIFQNMISLQGLAIISSYDASKGFLSNPSKIRLYLIGNVVPLSQPFSSLLVYYVFRHQQFQK